MASEWRRRCATAVLASALLLQLLSAALAAAPQTRPPVNAGPTPSECVSMWRTWDAQKGCVAWPQITAADCSFPNPDAPTEFAGPAETRLKWLAVNACKSKLPLVVSNVQQDDRGYVVAKGWRTIPYGGAAVLQYQSTPGGSDVDVVLTTKPADGAGRIALARPVDPCGAAGAAALARGPYCLVAGGWDEPAAFRTQKDASGLSGSSGAYYELEGSVVSSGSSGSGSSGSSSSSGAKLVKAAACDGKLHPKAVPLDIDWGCHPGCGGRMRLTNC